MITLVTADLHLSATPRDSYRHQFLAKLVGRAKAAGATRTLILGDLTEAKDRHNDWLVNQVVDAVERFTEFGEVIILQGNHDYYSDQATPFFGFLRHVPRVKWIGSPGEWDLAGLGYCLFLPHTRNYKADWAGIDLEGFDWIFAHNTFQGARGDSGHKLDGIPLDIFPKRARVIAGDVHVPQSIGCVTYVGAPYLIDFGDDYLPRCLLLEGNKGTGMPAKSTDPQKRVIDFIDGFQDQGTINPGDVIKARIHLARADVDAWPTIRNEARREIEKRGAIAHAILPIVTATKGRKVDYQNADPKSDDELVRAFAKSRGIDANTLKAGIKLI